MILLFNMMFRGLNKINLDAKGRIAIPVRYKDSLSDLSSNLLICTIDQDHCLLLYPLKFWKSIEKKIMELPTLHSASRRLQRLMVGHAAEIEMDSSGRILIPKELRAFAKLTKQAMLVGQGNKFEIWNYDDWNIGRERWLSSKETDLSPKARCCHPKDGVIQCCRKNQNGRVRQQGLEIDWLSLLNNLLFLFLPDTD